MSETRLIAAPLLKWPGGKGKLLKELLGRIPVEFGAYHEPFVGGGALFFGLYNADKIKKAYLSDLSPDLIDTYWAIQKDVEQVIEYLSKHQNDKAYYYAVRDSFPDDQPLAAEAARIIYLNKTCFNGLWRVNKAGDFNAAYGYYANPTICDPLKLRAAAQAFQRAEISHASFEVVSQRAQPGDFVYFDPPYIPASVSADFTEYSAEGFGPEQHIKLRDLARELHDRGVYVMISNSDTPHARLLYAEPPFKVEQVFAARTINVDSKKRGKVPELLVRTY